MPDSKGETIIEQWMNSAFGSAVGDASGVVKNGTMTLHIRGVENWNKYVPFPPAKALKILSCDLPEGTDITLSISKNGSGLIYMKKDGVFDESSDNGRSFSFTDGIFKKKSLNNGVLQVDPKYQGTGIGRHVLRNEIEFFYLCGIRRFNIIAGMDAGGYAWARQGFLPDDVSSSSFEQDVAVAVARRYRILSRFLEDEDHTALDKAVQFGSERAIWDIVAQDSDIPPALKSIFNTVADKSKAALDGDELDLFKAFNLGTKWDNDSLYTLAFDAKAGKKIPIGKMLLAGTRWDGHLDMSDAEQMARMEKYVGGWQYITSPGNKAATGADKPVASPPNP